MACLARAGLLEIGAVWLVLAMKHVSVLVWLTWIGLLVFLPSLVWIGWFGFVCLTGVTRAWGSLVGGG